MSNKLGLIATWWRICASGFGLGADAAKAAGIVVFILSLIFVIGIAIIWWIIKFFINRSKAKKAAEAQKAAEAKAAEVQKVEEAPKQEAEETPKQEA